MTVAKFILQPKTELSEDELKEYRRKYYAYIEDIVNEINTCFKEEMGSLVILKIIDKTVSPFQYWLVNELICKKINEEKEKG